MSASVPYNVELEYEQSIISMSNNLVVCVMQV